MVILTCRCGKRLSGHGTFYEVSKEHGWIPDGIYFVCPTCQVKSRGNEVPERVKK